MRKTKIICTLGPATDSPEVLARLIAAGANVFRLNMSHGTHEWVRTVVPRIREVARQTSANIAIMMDTQGPAIRTGDVATNLDLHPGDVVEFTVRGAKSEEHYSVDVNYDGLIDDIHDGDVVMVDNGNIHMKVLAKKENRVQCEVLTQGVLGSRRHINLPGVKVNLPPMTEKDLKDIVVGVETGVDYFALSFCRERSDVDAMRAELKRLGSDAHIIAKIEDQHAVKHVKEIVEAADAVMVARGDLGIECPMEELPIIQRRIVKTCLQVGKPVIVATHMLESMITNPLPTRAEITDVANAVYEQADAIMLSGETSVGKYPVQCVETFDRVARRIERSGGAGFAAEAVIDGPRQKTVAAAVSLANNFPQAKMVVFTFHGTMALYVSHLRPLHAPIFAFSPDERVCRRLALLYGVHAQRMGFVAEPDKNVFAAETALLLKGLAEPGDHLVVVTDILDGDRRHESVQLRIVP
ncbi:MAG: pyruvate kinase [Verrucomicrobia bacterium]|nr:pyruvate kinase [Verrucomicrobiota bacterium]MDA1204613.1 pyruvate kinase [Verrucomicrobiota bacterium]